MRLGISLFLLLLLPALGCGETMGNYKSAYSLNTVLAKPPTPLVAKKIQRPLYIVLDPKRVQNVWQMKSAERMFALTDFGQFVSRDLHDAMLAYFEQVVVVPPGAPMPSTPHIVADVKVDQVALHDLQTAMLTYTTIEMTWAFALRPSTATEYTFSYAGVAKSSESYPTFEAGCAQMVESAISLLLKEWNDKGGPAALSN